MLLKRIFETEHSARPSTSNVTVREVLAHPALAGSRVVAGARGLNRSVASIAVLDVNDLDSIQPGQLLLANAYSLLDANLLELIPNLNRRRSVALGLKLSDYWDEVPLTLIRAANSYSMPLIVMREGPFDEILNPVLTMLTERQFVRLGRADDLHATLTAAAVREQGEPSAIVESVHRAIGKPVALFGQHAKLLAFGGPQEVWSDSLMLDAIRIGRTGFLRFADEHWSITPIPGTGFARGVLCASGVEDHESFARAALSHAAVVIGMLQVERRQVEEVHRRFERELLEDVIAGRVNHEDEARERAAWLGWPLHQPFLVMALRLPPERLTTTSEDSLLDDLEGVLAALQLGGRLFSWRSMLGIVIHLGAEEDAEDVAEEVRLLVERFASERAIQVHRVKIGVAAPRTALMDLPNAFEEAALTVMLGRTNSELGRMSFFEDLGPAHLLCHSTDREGLLRAARDVLGDIYPDAVKRDSDLLRTLSALLASNMRLRSAAGELYLHYNTVRHRLGRLRRSLGRLLEDPYGRLELSAAVTALQLLAAREDLGDIGRRPR